MGKSKISLIKHGFFTNPQYQSEAFSFKEDDFDLDQLRTEFFSLYKLFVSNKDQWEKSPEIRNYVHFLSDRLSQYYNYDYARSDLEDLIKQRKKLDDSIQKINQQEKDSFIRFLFNQLKNNLKTYYDSLTHVEEFPNNIGKLNTNRSYFGYSRSLALTLIPYLENPDISVIIQQLNDLFGSQCNVLDGLNFLDETRIPSAILGISLFFLRFTIQFALIIKQLIEADTDKLSLNKVALQELEKRGFMMSNDLAWAITSLLTFYLSAEASSILTLSCLIFDAVWYMAQWFCEAQKYQTRLQALNTQKEGATEQELMVINRQIDMYNDEWEIQCRYYMINISGAVLIASSYSVILLFTGPFTILGMAFFSMVGNALYNTAEEYKSYQQACIALEREEANGLILDDEHHQELLTRLHVDCDEKNGAFWKAFTFNVGALAFIMTAAAASWPIALAITISYAGYQLHQNYQHHLQENPADEMADVYRLLPVMS